LTSVVLAYVCLLMIFALGRMVIVSGCYLVQKTRIGITVNNFRKTTGDNEISNLAKALIKSWKKLVHGK